MGASGRGGTVLMFLLILGLFATSVQLRAPWRGELGLRHHQWLTASTLLFSKNWYREGVVPLRMMMLKEPRSGEAQSIAERSPYVSFPPGAVCPSICSRA